MSSIFTIRAGGPSGGDVPSVTQLLDRKKLTHDKKPPAMPASHRADGPKIQPARRRAGTTHALIEWKRSQLMHTADPLGQALLALFAGGAQTILFLARDPVVTQDGSMIFSSKAYAGNSSRLSLWLGLRWSSSSVPPEFWSQILDNGQVELRAGSTRTMNTPVQTAFRASFGSMTDEHLTILRVGQNEFCRGLLVVFSPAPIGGKLKEALGFLSRPLAAPGA